MITDEQRREFGAGLYAAEELRRAAGHRGARLFLGCGNPTAVAELHPGETVLDLGSGAGLDVLLSARTAGRRKAYGLDKPDEMLALARRNQSEAGGRTSSGSRASKRSRCPTPASMSSSPTASSTSGRRAPAVPEAARVLRPGGRFAVSDVIADPDMDAATKADMAAYTGCIAGALTHDESSWRRSPPRD